MTRKQPTQHTARRHVWAAPAIFPLISLVSLVPLLLAACASEGMRPAAPALLANGVLTGTAGMTLYTFDRDPAGAGKSVCNDACARNWPPFFAPADAMPSGAYSVVVRDDGSRQWAYRGKPLYYWAKDKNPGERTGDGFNQVWHAATP